MRHRFSTSRLLRLVGTYGVEVHALVPFIIIVVLLSEVEFVTVLLLIAIVNRVLFVVQE